MITMAALLKYIGILRDIQRICMRTYIRLEMSRTRGIFTEMYRRPLCLRSDNSCGDYSSYIPKLYLINNVEISYARNILDHIFGILTSTCPRTTFRKEITVQLHEIELIIIRDERWHYIMTFQYACDKLVKIYVSGGYENGRRGYFRGYSCNPQHT